MLLETDQVAIEAMLAVDPIAPGRPARLAQLRRYATEYDLWRFDDDRPRVSYEELVERVRKDLYGEIVSEAPLVAQTVDTNEALATFGVGSERAWPDEALGTEDVVGVIECDEPPGHWADELNTDLCDEDLELTRPDPMDLPHCPEWWTAMGGSGYKRDGREQSRVRTRHRTSEHGEAQPFAAVRHVPSHAQAGFLDRIEAEEDARREAIEIWLNDRLVRKVDGTYYWFDMSLVRVWMWYGEYSWVEMARWRRICALSEAELVVLDSLASYDRQNVTAEYSTDVFRGDDKPRRRNRPQSWKNEKRVRKQWERNGSLRRDAAKQRRERE